MEYPVPDPIPTPTTFNSSYFFDITDAAFNFETASKYFVKITGGSISYLNSLQYINSPLLTASTRLEVNNTSSTPITSSSICTAYGLHLHSVLASSNGIYSGSSIAFNNSSTDNVPLASIYLDKRASNIGELVFASRDGLTCDERLRITDIGLVTDGSIISNRIGTNSISSLSIISNNVDRLIINNSGNIGISKSPNNLYKVDISGNLNISGNYFSNGVQLSLPPALNVQGSLNPANNPSVITGFVWYTNASRYYGQRFIDSNNFSLLTFSAGGVYNDALVYTHSATPLLECPLSNTTFKAPIINGTTRVDTPTLNATTAVNSILVNCQTSWSSGSSRDLFTIGNSGDNYARWTASVFYASSNFNSHMTIYNQNQSSYGINFGAGQVAGAAKGAMMVINGPNWDGAAITCGTSSPKATLHINGGKSSTVPSGYSFGPSGASPIAGGTVNISLFCFWNAWIEGSLYCTSDRRLKNIIKPIDPDNAMNLLNVTAQWYNWKKDSNGQPQLGLIAQDLLRENLTGLTSLFENNDVEEDDPEFDLKSKTQLVVTYDKIPLYLLEIIKNLNNRVKDLEKSIKKKK